MSGNMVKIRQKKLFYKCRQGVGKVSNNVESVDNFVLF